MVSDVVMRKLLIFLVLVLLFPTVSQSQDLYVSDYREVMVRTGPSLRNKIIAVLKTGNAVKLVREAEEDYYLVALPDGREGYILKGYVTEQIPPARQVQLLEDQIAKQNQELDRLLKENTRLQAAQEEIPRNEAEYTAQIQTLTLERNQLRRDASVSSFLAGAGVLLIGWLLGWTRLRLRRKSQRRPGLNLSL